MDTETVPLKFHHIGVAVPDLESALRCYVDVFGFERVTDPVEVPPQGVRVCFVRAQPGVMIELVEGAGEDSPVRSLTARGARPYHICYEVEDLDEALRQLRARGCRPCRRFELRTHGLARFAFVLSPDRQLFEICEPARKPEAVA